MERGAPRHAHVLIAEDEVLIAAGLRMVLEAAGYRVTVTHDGLAALEVEKRDPADVLLTDLQMPRLGGAELIRRVRARRPDVPVVAMSGDPPSGAGATLSNVWPDQVRLLRKPFPTAELMASLQAALVSRP